MKQLSIDDIKSVSLDLLKHFHAFCVENNLHYSLWGGSLIGAVRHKGFIPWDDDIDLCMPRPDYEKFFEIYKDSEDYACFNYNRGHALIAYGRLCDMKRTIGYSYLPWIDQKTGVYISIFPIDGSESDIDAYQNRYKRCRELFMSGYMYRSYLCQFSTHFSFRDNLSFLKKRIYSFLKRIKPIQSLDSMLSEHIANCLMYSYTDSNYVGHISFAKKGNFPKALWKKEDFSDYVLADFEGCKFYIIAGYDNHLRLRFGNYMELPPEKDRVPVHGYTKYYWT